ncbi:MAG: phosphate signaling complex protein PhoU [Pseudomonadota bacterium]|nr:phosphate signaling complex protein PhoU [Pseudomonadota bacterium]
MNDLITGHTVHSYDEELGALRGLVLEMGEYVQEQVQRAIKALTTGDINLARRVVDRDRQVDYYELDADDAIFNLIAKRQPAAVDLRLVLALSKVVGNLERAGDKAEHIAWCVIRLMEREGQHPSSKILHHVRRLDQVACAMLERSLDAFARADVDAALDVFSDDGRLDDELDAALRHLMTFVLEDTALVGQVLDMVFALRALESIGDYAGSIAEQVIFVAKGKDVRYQSRENLIEALRRRDGI